MNYLLTRGWEQVSFQLIVSRREAGTSSLERREEIIGLMTIFQLSFIQLNGLNLMNIRYIIYTVYCTQWLITRHTQIHPSSVRSASNF